MKKFLYSLLLSFFVVLSTTFFGCSVPTYTIEYGSFNTIVEYNSDFSFTDTGLSVVKKEGKSKDVFEITPDMIVSCDDTTTVGPKKLVVSFDEKTFIIDFVVKYKVEFVVDGEVVNTQYVLNKDEIEMPDNPTIDGCDFVSWTPSAEEEITDNTVYNAQFTVSDSGMPLLLTCNATYGDTLANVSLPQNDKGSWKFVDALSTSVGNAGEQVFDVKFIPNDAKLLAIKTDKVKVNVAKKTLKFKNVSQTFTYDGTEKIPTFDLDNLDIQTEYVPYYQGKAVNAGEYEFEIDIVDNNYKGSYYGTFTISSIDVVVSIDDLSIKFTDSYPQEFTYSVFDKDGNVLSEELRALMNLEIVEPSYQHAGLYEIGATVENPNFDVTINKGYLTVQKVEHDLSDSAPTFVNGANITYGSMLSSAVFTNTDVRGTWSWKNTDVKVLTPTTYTATAVFTPKEDKDYLVSEIEVELTVNKKPLTITVIENEFVYDKLEHSISYRVDGIEDNDDAVSIVGNQVQSTAGTYKVTIGVSQEDLRYIGSTDTSLIINQASISDFTTVYETEWSKTLLLQNIKLNNGYEWVNPLTSVTELGEQNYLAQFTPEDSVNYKTEKGEITINVVKGEAVISAPNSYTFSYNPNGYSLDGITCSHDESVLQYVYKLNGEQVAEISNVGTYQVILTLLESEHYTVATKTLEVVVNKADNLDTVITTRNATYGEKLSEYSLPTSDIGEWSWKAEENATVGNAGTQTHVAMFTPDTANYNGREIEVTFIISKAPVDLPTVEPKSYTSELITSGLEETDFYTVSDEGGTETGSYKAYLTLKDASNYRWPGEIEGSVAYVVYEIQKNVNNYWITAPYITVCSWEYIDEYNKGKVVAGEMVAESLLGDVIIEYKKLGADDSTYTTTMPTDAGKYVAKAYVVEDAKLYNGLIRENIEFEIKNIYVPVPEDKEVFYDGTIHYLGIESNYYAVENDVGYTNASTKKISVTLKDKNYVWEDGFISQQRDVILKIKQATNSWKNGGPNVTSMYKFTFADTYKPTAEANFGNVQFEYYKVNADSTQTKLESFPHDVGSYKVTIKVVGNDNFTGLEEVYSFNILPATLTFTAPTYDLNSIYYENTVDIKGVWVNAYTAIFENQKIDGEFIYDAPVLATSTVSTKTETINDLNYTRNYAQVEFSVTFTPSSNNFNVATTTAKINLYGVCRDSNKKYYGSIENALANTTSGTVTVVPYPTGDVKITKTTEVVEVKSGVTLVLPYLSTSSVEGVNTEGKATLSYNDTIGFEGLKLTSKVVVAAGVNILNNGTITIAGETSGGGAAGTCIAGNTARNYAKLVLEENATITTKGTINCFGYIDESYQGNGSQVIAEAGTVYMPFIIHDFRGGNYMLSAKNNGIAPFNQFELRNILPKLTIKYGANLIGHGNLWANLGTDQNNYSTVSLVGSGNSYVIQLYSGSFVVGKYNATAKSNTDDKWVEGVNDIHVYGGASTNALSLTVMATPITTAELDFPISWRQNITLHSGTYTMNQKFKLMTGSKFTVCEDANLTINTLTIYQSYSDNVGLSKGTPNYKANLPAGEFNLYGNLIATTIGGKINIYESASITVTNYTKTTNEVLKATEKSFYIPFLSDKYSITKQEIKGGDLVLCYKNGPTDGQIIEAAGYYTYSATDNKWVITTQSA